MKNGKFTKILALLLVSIMVLSITPINGLGELFTTTASAETQGDYTYTVDENGNATITAVADFTGTETAIPDNLGGHPVTKIGEGAYSNFTNLVKLNIPKSVVYFGNGAFGGVYTITTVIYDGSKTDWDKIYFGGNNGSLELERQYFTETLPEGKVYYIIKDVGVVITDAEKTIGPDLTIPSFIDGYPVAGTIEPAFSGCYSLESVTISDGVSFVGVKTFYDCRQLRRVTIPNSMKRIERDAFANCPISEVYYYGGEDAWNCLLVDEGNGVLTEAPRHYIDYSHTALPEARTQTVKYKNKVTVRITATGIPVNGLLVVDGIELKPDVQGTAVFEKQYQAKETRTFKVRIEDEEGNIKVAEQELKIEVNTGFFAKIAAFFTEYLFNWFKWKSATIEF